MQAADSSSGANRRREKRIAHRAVIVMLYGQDQDQRAVLMDCSPHGVSLLLEKPAAEGSNLLLKLDQGDDAPVAAYEVRHCTESPDGFLVGAQFLGFIANADDTLDGHAAFEKLLSM